MPTKVLFISHDAYQAGAPILLLNLATAIKKSFEERYQISFLINRAPFTILDRFSEFDTRVAIKELSPLQRISNRVAARLKFSLRTASIYRHKVIAESLRGVDVVVSNTITNGDIIPLVRQYFKGPIVSYVHELEMSAAWHTTPENIRNVTANTTVFLVPSDAVRQSLIANYKISTEKICYLPYYIPGHISNTAKRSSSTFVVGASGTIEWRRGPDLFIQVARTFFLLHAEADVRFVWKGAVEGLELDRLLYDVRRLQLSDRVFFEKRDSNMEDFYHSLDVFLLTSREDPYPLVVLEAASAKVPTISFYNNGGASEFITKHDAGFCVDYLDAESMAKALLKYFNDSDLLFQLGQNAYRGLRETHQNESYVLGAFDKIMQNLAVPAK